MEDGYYRNYVYRKGRKLFRILNSGESKTWILGKKVRIFGKYLIKTNAITIIINILIYLDFKENLNFSSFLEAIRFKISNRKNKKNIKINIRRIITFFLKYFV